MSDHLTSTRREIVAALTIYLANTAVVYYKTHSFHWNVEGQNFYTLHLMFEKFYQELWESMDEVAERIRALGEKAPPNYVELLKNASIKEAETIPASHIMLTMLRDDYSALAQKAHEVEAIAEANGDRVTTDMMTAKATFLEKAVWMLHSSAMP